ESAAGTASARRTVGRNDASGTRIRGSASGRQHKSGNAGRGRRTVGPSLCARIQAIRRGHAAPLSHTKASRTSPGNAGSDGPLVIGSCLRDGLFRPRPFGASFPTNARYDAWGLSMVATLEGTREIDLSKVAL